MGKMFASSTVIQVLYSLLVFRDYINKLQPPVKGVVMIIKNLYSEIEMSSEPVRTSNYVSYLRLQHYEPECNMMHMNVCYSCLQKFIPILMMTACLK